MVLIDTRFNKDDLDSTIESFEEEETEAEEGLDQNFKIIEESDDSSDEDRFPPTLSPSQYPIKECRVTLQKVDAVKDEDDESSEIPRILESFGKSAGFGSNLRPLLPANRNESSDADSVASFLLFVLERH